eukprot:1135522-Prorocentrum_minimum.AAC.4
MTRELSSSINYLRTAYDTCPCRALPGLPNHAAGHTRSIALGKPGCQTSVGLDTDICHPVRVELYRQVRCAASSLDPHPRLVDSHSARNILCRQTSRTPSIGIYSAVRHVAPPQSEYTLPPDQSQPLNRNILCRQTSRTPSTGIIYSAVRQVAPPQ